MNKDYYQILGVTKNATADDINKAYYKLAHKYHPDKGTGDEKKFKEINEAYQILSNREKRAQYDQFGRVFSAEGGPAPGGDGFSDFQWAWGNPRQGFGNNVEFDLGDLGEMVEEMFGFGGGSNSNKRKRDLKRGKDIEIAIEINLEDTIHGIDKEISLLKYVDCSRCDSKGAEPGTKIKECFSCRGTGEVQQVRKTFLGSFTQWTICPECKGEGYRPEKPCNVCKGEGRTQNQEKIKIRIPAGIDSNQVIKIDLKGDAGRRSGKAGDLYARIIVKKHPLFNRKGDDLYFFAQIPFSRAVLGGEVNIPTIDRKDISLKVPQGTESGKILRISDKGITRFSGRGRGDMYVQLNIKTPDRITRQQKELLEKLKKEGL